MKIVGKSTYVNVYAEDLESGLIEQIYELINNPVFSNPISIMPDAHIGKGCVIGFTMKLADKIIPEIIGVDIGCGMLADKVNCKITPSLELDKEIRKAIPFGNNVNKTCDVKFPWEQIKASAKKLKVDCPDYNDKWFKSLCKRIGIQEDYALNSLGSLGGGNHFIEIGKEDNNFWVVIHSGSRNLGLKVCNYWMKQINKINKINPEDRVSKITELKKIYNGKDLENEIRKIKVVNKNYLVGDDYYGYLFDMVFAQAYAKLNRKIMMNRILEVLNCDVVEEIETIHNYINFEDMIIRKGAVRSNVGEKLIIPLNMRDGILICEGKGNDEWNNSAPHGAGRVMSRGKAKSILDVGDFENDMVGVFSTSVGKSTIDEAPRAYKDGKVIERLIEPTANVVGKIIPIHNLKGV
jgi:tRNA-splicing ligase RtcB